jgi:hypothetical protein
MVPNKAERDALFKKFGRTLFEQGLDALYDVVTQDFTYSILVSYTPRVLKTRDEFAGFF